MKSETRTAITATLTEMLKPLRHRLKMAHDRLDKYGASEDNVRAYMRASDEFWMVRRFMVSMPWIDEEAIVNKAEATE